MHTIKPAIRMRNKTGNCACITIDLVTRLGSKMSHMCLDTRACDVKKKASLQMYFKAKTINRVINYESCFMAYS